MSKPHLCPKCLGEREVANLPDVAYVTTTAPCKRMCPTCSGVGVLWEMDVASVPSITVTDAPLGDLPSYTVYNDPDWQTSWTAGGTSMPMNLGKTYG